MLTTVVYCKKEKASKPLLSAVASSKQCAINRHLKQAWLFTRHYEDTSMYPPTDQQQQTISHPTVLNHSTTHISEDKQFCVALRLRNFENGDTPPNLFCYKNEQSRWIYIFRTISGNTLQNKCLYLAVYYQQLA